MLEIIHKKKEKQKIIRQVKPETGVSASKIPRLGATILPPLNPI